MPDFLPALEAERSQILHQLTTLGDLRPGSICAVPRRCGKPTCHCAKPKDPGHDPQLRLTYKLEGKTMAESFASPAAFHKAQMEIHEYQRFQKLCTDLVTVNQKICRLRPAEKPAQRWSAEEKNGCCGPSGNHTGIR
jgi:hypothetical protein